jgi:hypothetical protein
MARSQPFDAIPQITRYLHPTSCGLLHDFDTADCLVGIAAATELLEGLRRAGLLVLPSNVANFVSRRFDEMTSPDEPQSASSDSKPMGLTSFLYTEIVRIRSRRQDGSFVRTEPMPRPMAEIVLADHAWSHDDDIVGAIIEVEPTWIDGLMRDLGQNYTGWAA